MNNAGIHAGIAREFTHILGKLYDGIYLGGWKAYIRFTKFSPK